MNYTPDNKQVVRSALSDIRKAYRLLYEIQERMQHLVFYIMDQYKFQKCAGQKLFSNPIANGHYVDEYANLKIFKDMWAWDFFYGYLMEYYFADKGNICMSVLPVMDDGYFRSELNGKSPTNIRSYENAEQSESFILLIAESVKKSKWDKSLWLHGWHATFEETMERIIRQPKPLIIPNRGEGYYICKRYPMEEFLDQVSTDCVLRDFAKVVYKHTGINLLNR